MNKPGEAKTYFERAMSGEQVSFDTLWNYAVFSFSHNDFRTALRLITRIETGYSLTPDLMMLKARTYENLGRKDKAAQEYRAILTAGKDVPDDLQQFARARLQVLDAEMSDSYSEIKHQAN
jgi:type IV pilus assembly protein PilQ